jgi:hypothetical protein
MLDNLPTYQSPDLRLVRAGRIKEVTGARLKVSTAPVGFMASLSTGYPLIPIPINEHFLSLMRPREGSVLIIDASFDIGLSDADAFLAAYKLVGEVKPPLREQG